MVLIYGSLVIAPFDSHPLEDHCDASSLGSFLEEASIGLAANPQSTKEFRKTSYIKGEFIEREHRAVRDDGSILTIPRKAASLRDSAVPTLFDFLPDPHPSGHSIRRPRSGIANLHVLKKEIEWRLKEELHGWNIVYDEDLPALSACKIVINEVLEPEIKVSVTFDAELVVKIVHPDVVETDLNRALGDSSTCDDWNKLSRLMRLLNGEQPPEKKTCRMKVFETGDVVVLEISQDEPTYQDERINQGESLPRTKMKPKRANTGVVEIKTESLDLDVSVEEFFEGDP